MFRSGPNKRLIPIVISFCLSDVIALTAVVAQGPPTNPPGNVAGNQESLIRQQQQERDEERARQNLPAPRAPFSIILRQTQESGRRFKINRVDVAGVSERFKAEVDALTSARAGSEMGKNEIERLVADIQQVYNRRGFGLVQVRIPEQDLSKGELHLSVFEGKLESLIICKDGKTRTGPDMAFRLPEGGLLKIRRYEQGLDNIGRLSTFEPVASSYHEREEAASCANVQQEVDVVLAAQAQRSIGDVLIVPGTKYGYSEVIVSTRQPRPFWVSGGADNFGSAQTGQTRLNAALAVEDILGLYEQITVQGSHTSDFSEGADRARNLGGYINVPFGYWNLAASYSYYDYRTTLSTGGQPFISEGSQRFFGLDLSRVIVRSADHNIGLSASLDLKEVQNFIDGVKLSNSSRKLAVLSGGVSGRGRILKGNYYANITIARGLSAFGALRDQFSARDVPHAQFTSVSATFDYQRPVYLPVGHKLLLEWYKAAQAYSEGKGSDPGTQPFPDMLLKTSLSASWAPHALYGSEKMQIGGPFTVRGFSDQNLSGDFGGYLRNEISWFPRLSDNSRFLNRIGRPSLFAGFDVGTILNDHAEPSFEKSLAGAVFGGRLSGRNLSIEARVEAPLIKPAAFTGQHALFRFQVNLRL
jgi:hemolysin activation/secretion protein